MYSASILAYTQLFASFFQVRLSSSKKVPFCYRIWVERLMSGSGKAVSMERITRRPRGYAEDHSDDEEEQEASPKLSTPPGHLWGEEASVEAAVLPRQEPQGRSGGYHDSVDQASESFSSCPYAPRVLSHANCYWSHHQGRTSRLCRIIPQ